MIKIYSTGCPKCNVLIKKLNEKNIDYDICSDVDFMINKGVTQVPMAEIDGKLMDFKQSIEWINNI